MQFCTLLQFLLTEVTFLQHPLHTETQRAPDTERDTRTPRAPDTQRDRHRPRGPLTQREKEDRPRGPLPGEATLQGFRVAFCMPLCIFNWKLFLPKVCLDKASAGLQQSVTVLYSQIHGTSSQSVNLTKFPVQRSLWEVSLDYPPHFSVY